MKRIFLMLIVLFVAIQASAQTPQFAVVRPDGTTYVCPTWDSAYNKSVDGDNIYLPGVILNQDITIDKRINIYGSGHHPDSSLAIGTTQLRRAIILKGASGGYMEGIKFNVCDPYGYQYSIQFGNSESNTKVVNYTIKRSVTGCINIGQSNFNPDSLGQAINLIENIIVSIDGRGSQNHFISKNIIQGPVFNVRFSSLNNNVFLVSGLTTVTQNCSFENNIFLSTTEMSPSNGGHCGNTYTKNLKLNTGYIGCCVSSCVNTTDNFVSVASANDIFLQFAGGGAFLYSDNYHLRSSCPGKNAGTDGTDVGIYGTSQPTSEGWVPSNPHIYFKQVAPQTNSSGQLQIQFKVRTNN